jgi:hypothetical protein
MSIFRVSTRGPRSLLGLPGHRRHDLSDLTKSILGQIKYDGEMWEAVARDYHCDKSYSGCLGGSGGLFESMVISPWVIVASLLTKCES